MNKKEKEIFKTIRILCGPMRFRILIALSGAGRSGLSVTNMALIFNTTLSRISHQLQILRKHKFVKATKRNHEVVYTLSDHRVQKYLS